MNRGRPPTAHFNKMRPILKKEYPDKSPEEIDEIAAGIWHHNYKPRTIKKLKKKYEGSLLGCADGLSAIVASLWNIAAKEKSEWQRIDKSRANKLNGKFVKMGQERFLSMDHAWDKIKAALDESGIVALQEDNTEQQTIHCGFEGRLIINIADKSSKNGAFYSPYEKSALSLHYYKDKSVPGANYDVVATVS